MYHFTKLPSPQGYALSEQCAFAINAAGAVAGYAFPMGFVWLPNGDIVTLGPYPPGTGSVGYWINQAFLVTGKSGHGSDQEGEVTTAVTWNATMSAAPLSAMPVSLPPSTDQGTGVTICVNDSGGVLLRVKVNGVPKVFVVTSQDTVELPCLPGDQAASGKFIDNSGNALGLSKVGNVFKAVIWPNGQPVSALPVNRPLSQPSQAIHKNDSGWIVGEAVDFSTGQFRACLWRPGQSAESLGVLPGFEGSSARAITSDGKVFGYCWKPGSESGYNETHAFIWTEAGGMQLLASLLTNPLNPGDSLVRAMGVNSSGQVVGQATVMGGISRAFRLDPV